MLCWNYSQAQKDKQPSPTKLQLLAVKNLVKALEKELMLLIQLFQPWRGTMEEPAATFSEQGPGDTSLALKVQLR